VSTRIARFGDHWKNAQRRPYPVRCFGLEYTDLRCFKDGAVGFAPGITALVGGNGVGKSTLAHAIIEVLAGANQVAELATSKVRTSGSSLRAQVEVEGVTSHLAVESTGGGRAFSGSFAIDLCRWLEPSSMAYRCQHQVLGDSNFSDVLEGAGPKTLSGDGLATISYLVGKDYVNCDVYEIADYGPFQVWPYFKVTVGGVTYGSEAMGRGELALLSAYWVIDTAPPNSILVLEEPETHVSGRSQSALMDVLAQACATKAISAIVTSHSPIVIGKLPKENVRLIVNEGAASSILQEPKDYQVAGIVGGGVAFRFLVLVEDACARSFALSILDKLDPDLRRQCATAELNGFGAICKIIETLPQIKEWGRLVACFDGDVRAQVAKLESKFKWPHLYLPGVNGPEAALRSTVGVAATGLASELRLDEGTVAVALNAATGMNDHDWLAMVVAQLHRPLEEVVRAMTNVWLLSNEGEAKAFVSQVRASL
jgi:predicted ATPase